MALLVVNQGEGIMLENILNKTAPQSMVLCLYQNDWTPADGDDEGDATEADFTGYSNVACAPGDWTVTPGAPSEAVCTQKTFTSTANQTTQNIYGYYVKQTTSGKLMWAERFTDGP